EAVRDLLQGPAARRGAVLLVETLLHPGEVSIIGFAGSQLQRHAERGGDYKPVALNIPFLAAVAGNFLQDTVSLSPHTDKKVVGRSGKISFIVAELQRQRAE